MNQTKSPVSRALVGLIAVVCLVAALVLWLWTPENLFLSNSLFRVGIVMVVFWFALPTKNREAAWARISPWALVGIAVAAILIPRLKPVMIPVIIVVVVAALFLRPRKKNRNTIEVTPRK